jgi:hypothetical protein
MKTSLFEKLRQPTTVVLSAGHGAGDPGTVNGDFKEADEAIIIVDAIAKQLEKKGITVDIVPHENGLKTAIKYVNARYDGDGAWAIEIHRGSADGLPVKQASLRCGVYYHPSQGSTEIGIFMANALKRFGAHGTSWARPNTESGFTRLGWIRDTEPVAHLLELGSMEGGNSKRHLLKLAKIAAQSLYEAFTGVAWDDGIDRIAGPRDRAKLRRATPAVPAVPMVVVTPASTLLDQLVSAYKGKDLAAMFKKLKAKVHPEDFDDLQNASLAQWILESGWANSPLARGHFNFGGLKWRPEMANWTEAKDGVLVQPVKYTAHDGLDTYCKFASPSAYINGYWRFLMRSPYDGWERHASNPKDYISYLLKCDYTVSDTYLNDVLNLVPKAIALLAGTSVHPESAPLAALRPLPEHLQACHLRKGRSARSTRSIGSPPPNAPPSTVVAFSRRSMSSSIIPKDFMPIAPSAAGKPRVTAFSLTSWSTATGRFISAAPSIASASTPAATAWPSGRILGLARPMTAPILSASGSKSRTPV